MKKVLRIDNSLFEGVEHTAQGYLRAPATVGKVGVLRYRQADGTVRKELRLPEEVFHPDSMASLNGVPVTNDHPKELLDANNTKNHMIGFTGEKATNVEQRFLKTTITVTDSKTIANIESGKQEVSGGYMAALEEEPGTWEGEPYDAIQREIVYNHVAIVDRGRAGPEVRLRLDSSAAVLDETKTKTKTGDTMKIKMNGKEYEVTDEVKKAFDEFMKKQDEGMETLKKDMEEMKKQDMEAMKKDMEEMKKKDMSKEKEDEKKEDKYKEKMDALQARIDNYEEDAKKNNAEKTKQDFNRAVQKRVALEKTASRFIEDSMDSMTDREIMEQVVLAKSPNAEFKGKHDSYVQARFDHICESADESEETISRVEKTFSKKFDGQDVDPVKAARNRMMEDAKNAWKPKENKN